MYAIRLTIRSLLDLFCCIFIVVRTYMHVPYVSVWPSVPHGVVCIVQKRTTVCTEEDAKEDPTRSLS